MATNTYTVQYKLDLLFPNVTQAIKNIERLIEPLNRVKNSATSVSQTIRSLNNLKVNIDTTPAVNNLRALSELATRIQGQITALNKGVATANQKLGKGGNKNNLINNANGRGRTSPLPSQPNRGTNRTAPMHNSFAKPIGTPQGLLNETIVKYAAKDYVTRNGGSFTEASKTISSSPGMMRHAQNRFGEQAIRNLLNRGLYQGDTRFLESLGAPKHLLSDKAFVKGLTERLYGQSGATIKAMQAEMDKFIQSRIQPIPEKSWGWTQSSSLAYQNTVRAQNNLFNRLGIQKGASGWLLPPQIHTSRYSPFVPTKANLSKLAYIPKAPAMPAVPQLMAPTAGPPVPPTLMPMGKGFGYGRVGRGFNMLDEAHLPGNGGMITGMLKGMGIAYAIMGVGEAVGNIVGQAVSYDNTMKTVENILKSNNTDPNFAQKFGGMTQNVRKVGMETKFTVSEVADAAKFLAMAGMDVNQINAAIRPVADIALIGDTDLGTTADLITNIMTGYDVGVGQIRSVADIMTRTFTMTNTTLPEIAESYKYASAILKLADVDFAEGTAAIGILGDAGIKGSQAGTTLRTMIRNITDPRGKRKQNMWKKLKVDPYRSNGTLKSLVEIFSELNEQGVGLKEIQTLFDKTASSGAGALLMHAAKWKRVYEANLVSSGLSSRLADEKKNTLQGRWAQFISTITDNGVSSFGMIQSTIADALGKATDWLKSDTGKNVIQELTNDIFDLIKAAASAAKTFYGWFQKFKPFVMMWAKFQLLIWPVVKALTALKTIWHALLFARRQSLALGMGALGAGVFGGRFAGSGMSRYMTSPFEVGLDASGNPVYQTPYNVRYTPQGTFVMGKDGQLYPALQGTRSAWQSLWFGPMPPMTKQVAPRPSFKSRATAWVGNYGAGAFGMVGAGLAGMAAMHEASKEDSDQYAPLLYGGAGMALSLMAIPGAAPFALGGAGLLALGGYISSLLHSIEVDKKRAAEVLQDLAQIEVRAGNIIETSLTKDGRFVDYLSFKYASLNKQMEYRIKLIREELGLMPDVDVSDNSTLASEVGSKAKGLSGSEMQASVLQGFLESANIGQNILTQIPGSNDYGFKVTDANGKVSYIKPQTKADFYGQLNLVNTFFAGKAWNKMKEDLTKSALVGIYDLDHPEAYGNKINEAIDKIPYYANPNVDLGWTFEQWENPTAEMLDKVQILSNFKRDAILAEFGPGSQLDTAHKQYIEAFYGNTDNLWNAYAALSYAIAPGALDLRSSSWLSDVSGHHLPGVGFRNGAFWYTNDQGQSQIRDDEHMLELLGMVNHQLQEAKKLGADQLVKKNSKLKENYDKLLQVQTDLTALLSLTEFGKSNNIKLAEDAKVSKGLVRLVKGKYYAYNGTGALNDMKNWTQTSLDVPEFQIPQMGFMDKNGSLVTPPFLSEMNSYHEAFKQNNTDVFMPPKLQKFINDLQNASDLSYEKRNLSTAIQKWQDHKGLFFGALAGAEVGVLNSAEYPNLFKPGDNNIQVANNYKGAVTINIQEMNVTPQNSITAEEAQEQLTNYLCCALTGSAQMDTASRSVYGVSVS